MINLKHYKVNALYQISLFFIITTSIITSIYSYSIANEDIGKFIFILPIIYLFSYSLVLGKAVFFQPKLFLIVYTIISYIRYVILPLLMSHTTFYGGRSAIPPTENQYSYAILLMAYELIVLSIFIFIKSYGTNSSIYHINKIKFENKSYFIFVIFTIFTILLFLNNISVLNQFNFVSTTSKSLEIYGDYSQYSVETGALYKLSGYLLNILKQAIFVLIIYKLGFRYRNNRKKVYFNLAMIVGILNIAIYYGANRSDLLLQAIATLVILYSCFSDKKKQIFTVIGAVSISVVVVLSLARQHNISTSSQGVLAGFADAIQIYLGGPYNVALAIDMSSKYLEFKNVITLISDLTRSVFGVSFIVKDFASVLSTDIFNWRIFGVTDYGTQILPMIGQGYFYFGFILSPIFGVLFFQLAYMLENILLKTKSPVLFYFISITCLRLGFVMSQNTVIQLNDLSYNLFIPAIIVFLNKRIVIKSDSILEMKE